jgi:hypothetical protein
VSHTGKDTGNKFTINQMAQAQQQTMVIGPGYFKDKQGIIRKNWKSDNPYHATWKGDLRRPSERCKPGRKTWNDKEMDDWMTYDEIMEYKENEEKLKRYADRQKRLSFILNKSLSQKIQYLGYDITKKSHDVIHLKDKIAKRFYYLHQKEEPPRTKKQALARDSVLKADIDRVKLLEERILPLMKKQFFALQSQLPKKDE